jgi:hypothetical protein
MQIAIGFVADKFCKESESMSTQMMAPPGWQLPTLCGSLICPFGRQIRPTQALI